MKFLCILIRIRVQNTGFNLPCSNVAHFQHLHLELHSVYPCHTDSDPATQTIEEGRAASKIPH
jgi:hypothetical protein